MKKAVILLLGVACSIGLFAQNNDKEELGKSDPKAEALLKDVSKKYKGYKTMRVVFTLSISSPQDDVNDQYNGTLYLKGDKYKLEMGKQEIINNGETVWTYLKDAQEVQVNNYSPDQEESIQPTDIFTIYDSDFLAAMNGTEKVNGQQVKVIDMTPYDKSKNYFKIRLKVNEKTKEIVSAKIFDKNGNRYTYKVKKFAPNLNMPDNFFSWNKSKHPKVDVIDLR